MHFVWNHSSSDRFFLIDSSRDILGFTHITAVLFNPEERILQRF